MKATIGFVLAAALASGGCYMIATPGGISVGMPMPTTVVIPSTQIRVVQDYDDVLWYGGYYYRYNGGYWWRSSYYNTGWVMTRSVPRAFLNIPPSHPRYSMVRFHPLYRPPRVPTPQRPSKLDGKEEQQQQQQPSSRLPNVKSKTKQ